MEGALGFPPAGAAVGGSTTRRTTRNALVNASSQVLGKLLTFAWTAVAARRLVPADFGLFFYALGVSQLLSGVAEWGFDTRMVRLVSREPERAGALARAALALKGAAALPLLAAGGLVLATGRDGRTVVAVLALLVAAELDVLSDTCRAIGQAAQQQGLVSAALVAQRLLTSVAAVVAVLVSRDVRGLAAAFAAGSALGLVAHALAVRRLALPPAVGWRGQAPRLVRGSLALGLSALALMGLAKVDTLILGLLKGDVAVGGYAANYRLFETVLFASFAVSGALLPVMAAASAEEIGGMVRAGGVALSTLYLPFTAVCLVEARPLLRLLYGAPFGGYAAQLRWLCVAAVPYGLAYVGDAALVAVGRNRGMLRVALGALGSNIVLNLALVPTFSGTGCAAATALSYGVEAVWILVLLRDVISWRALGRGLVGPAAAAIGTVLLALVLPAPLLVRLPVEAVGYLVLLLLIQRRLAPEELRALRGLVSRGGR